MKLWRRAKYLPSAENRTPVPRKCRM